jgi:hypothetical protein
MVTEIPLNNGSEAEDGLKRPGKWPCGDQWSSDWNQSGTSNPEKECSRLYLTQCQEKEAEHRDHDDSVLQTGGPTWSGTWDLILPWIK